MSSFNGDDYPTENYTIGYVCESPESPMNFWTLFRLDNFEEDEDSRN